MSPPAFKVPESPTLPKYVLALVFCKLRVQCRYSKYIYCLYLKKIKKISEEDGGVGKGCIIFWCLSCPLKITFKLDY